MKTPAQHEDHAWFVMWMFLFLIGCAGAIADPFLGWPHPYTAVIFGWLACSGPAMAYGRSEVVAGRTSASPPRQIGFDRADIVNWGQPIRKSSPCGCFYRLYQDQTVTVHCRDHCPEVRLGQWSICVAHGDGVPPGDGAGICQCPEPCVPCETAEQVEILNRDAGRTA